MKKLFIILIVLTFALSNYALAESKTKKERQKEERAKMCELAENRLWIFETSTNNWTAKNLAYGPLEILAGVFTPPLGMLAGGITGAAVPHYFMKKGSEFLLPVTIPCGMAAGAACGLAITPVCAIEGLFDTITFGAFSDKYFSWINTEELKKINVKSIEKGK